MSRLRNFLISIPIYSPRTRNFQEDFFRTKKLLEDFPNARKLLIDFPPENQLTTRAGKFQEASYIVVAMSLTSPHLFSFKVSKKWCCCRLIPVLEVENISHSIGYILQFPFTRQVIHWPF